MNPTLGKRHLKLANNTEFTRNMHPETLKNSNDRLWLKFDEQAAGAVDATDGISGDDLARIAAFEPKREPSLWSDVRKEGASNVRSAA
ncbi:hypothetical protein [Brevibacterium oceani]|uniref:hypothetical protein n=1 Tax=Brevibacterium oceani TaxID=358099 RepID=UPI0015E78CED|nr:hypothetical protein [Brevibacterium oceani]